MSKSFAPTPAELALVNSIFAKGDPQKLGIITGDAAVDVFSSSKLSSIVLGEIWQLADTENQGWLSRKGVAIAVRLMGWAQKGEPITDALVNKPGPLPTLEGFTVPTPSAAPPKPMSPAPTGLPLLTQQDKNKFATIFAKCGPVSGLVTGEKARDVFLKSKLPVDKLSQIWSLADTKNRGSLDLTDFTIGMYLIQACMSGQLPFVPTSLPPGLYEQAGGTRTESVISHATGSSGSFSPGLAGSFPGRSGSAIQPQYTGGAAPLLQQQYTGQGIKPTPSGPHLPPRPAPGASFFGGSPAPQAQAQAWDVTSAEKANADHYFAGLDTQKRGYIEGDVAVPILVQSKLPEEALAQVWDLADINNDGRLTPEGFAIALHLIQKKLGGQDLPATLPPSLVPPSKRAAAPAPPSGPLQDLLWDETPPASASHPPLQPQATGPLSPQVQMFARPTSPPQRAAPAVDPFGSGAFGGSPAPHRDLLGDDDEPGPASSPPLHDQSAEIGNTRNQLSSTNRSLENAKTERASVEQALANQATELSSLQTHLSSAKAAYETETRLLATLRERFTAQSAEIQKTKEELIRSESELSGLRLEKAEVGGTLLREKDEVRDLQRRMKEVGTEIEMIKLDIEKAKKEAKQQKGLLAIAKKQLSAREAERAKVEKELEEANAEVREAVTDKDEVEAELAKEVPPIAPNGHLPQAGSPDSVAIAAAQPLPMSPPEQASPTPSILSPNLTGRSNNPFERLTKSPGSSSPRSQSPFAPFSNTALPTPPGPAPSAFVATPETESVDPFGFTQAFETEEPAAVKTPTAEDNLFEPTPRQAPATPTAVNVNVEPPTSPTSAGESELYTTPPQTANGPFSHAALAEPLNEGSSGSPDATPRPGFAGPSIPGGFPGADHDDHAETDLGSQLVEKEVEESDSDTDSDDEPLASKAAKGKAPEVKVEATTSSSPPNLAPTSSAFDDAFGESTPTETTSSITSPSPFTGSSPFHSQEPSAISTGPVQDAFGAPSTGSPFGSSPAPPAENGVKEFDEALGKFPSGASNAEPAPFTFDSAFDDNFDFASVSAPAAPAAPAQVPLAASPFPPAPSANSSAFDGAFGAPFTNGNAPVIPPTTAVSTPLSFEDAFGSSLPEAPAVAVPSGATNGANHASAFDDAYGAVASSPLTMSSNNYTGTVSSRTSATSQFQPPSSPPPFASAPTSPSRHSESAHTRVERSASPPLRAAARPRPQTAGSKDDKSKDVRHSRLSQIRLPFGKKKNKQDSLPPPIPAQSSSYLSPPSEEPTGTGTPASEDDIEPVKQLCGMGFSRSQVVAALEKTDYDVQKALNNLLGGH